MNGRVPGAERAGVFLAVLGVLIVPVARARAEEPIAPATPAAGAAAPLGGTRFSIAREASLIALDGVGYAATRVGAGTSAATLDRFPLDPATISLGIDRWVVDRHGHVAARVSDGLVPGLIALPLLYVIGEAIAGLAASRPRMGWMLGRDVLVLAETFLTTTVLVEMSKSAVARPRPFTYRADLGGYEANGDAVRSFFSGHSATAFAAATTFSIFFLSKRSAAPVGVKAAVVALSYVLAATTATLRVMAGKHFWTDVAVGSAVGILVGAVVPLAHGALDEAP